MTHLLTLPWPAVALWPNRTRRLHWAVLHRARKSQLAAVKRACEEAGVVAAERAAMEFEFYPPDVRRRDVDGCISALKGAVDEIAAALALDDADIPIRFPAAFAAPVERGAVIVKIEIPA